MDVAAAAYILMHYIIHKKKKNSRRWWQLRLHEQRAEYGGRNLLRDLKFQSVSGIYKNFTRMSPTDFDFLLNLIGPRIERKNTKFREAISIQERLAVTLRFLATGDSYVSLQYLFKISKQAISVLVPEVCEALIEGLKENIKVRKILLIIKYKLQIQCVKI